MEYKDEIIKHIQAEIEAKKKKDKPDPKKKPDGGPTPDGQQEKEKGS
jgi:hypothetical protein